MRSTSTRPDLYELARESPSGAQLVNALWEVECAALDAAAARLQGMIENARGAARESEQAKWRNYFNGLANALRKAQGEVRRLKRINPNHQNEEL